MILLYKKFHDTFQEFPQTISISLNKSHIIVMNLQEHHLGSEFSLDG